MWLIRLKAMSDKYQIAIGTLRKWCTKKTFPGLFVRLPGSPIIWADEEEFERLITRLNGKPKRKAHGSLLQPRKASQGREAQK